MELLSNVYFKAGLPFELLVDLKTKEEHQVQKTATIFSVILLIITICILSPAEIIAAASETNSSVDGINPTGRVEISENSPQKAIFHFDLSGLQDHNVQINGLTCRDVSLKGEGNTIRQDMPKLPAVSRWVVIPDGMSINLVHRDESKRIINSDLPPVINRESGVEYSTQISNPGTDNELTSGLYPPEPVIISNPVRMRNIRMAQVTVYPVQYNPVTKEYVERDELNVELQFTPDQSRTSGLNFERIPSPDFQRLIETIAVNPPPHRDNRALVEARGYYEYYLFVLPDNIGGGDQDAIHQQVYRLMEWKRRAGNKVDLLRVSDGDVRGGMEVVPQIQAHYDALLDQGIEPFDNILLIGEEELNPQNNNEHGQGMDILLTSPGSDVFDEGGWEDHWDLFYAYLEHEGDEPDFIPDVAVSRFQAGDIAMLVNGVNKTLSYESEPNMEDTSWFEEAIVEEEPVLNGGNSVIFTTDYYVYALENNGFNVVSQFRRDAQDGSFWLGREITEGIGFIAGRAQNESMNYSSNPPANELMEAVGVYPITILNSGHGESTMETLFWVGREHYNDPENYNDPSGAKGAVAVTCTWAIPTTTPNNGLGIGMVHSMLDLRLSFGWARNWTLLNLLRTFAEDEENFTFMKYSSDFQLTGEPGIKQWEGVPSLISVVHPEVLAQGASYVPVHVTDRESGEGVADVRVTLYKGTIEDINQLDVDLFDIMYTGDDGRCFFVIDPDIAGNIQITALEQDIYPYKGIIQRVDSDVSIVAGIAEINDAAGGNGDGIVNLNETIVVSLSASNMGDSVDAVNVIGVVTSLSDGAMVADNRTEFGNIAVGETSEITADIELEVSYPCSDGEQINLLVDFESENGTWSSTVSFDPQTENLRIASIQPGMVIEHGEQQFNLELFNSGRITTSEFTARLIPSGWGVVFPVESLEFNAIESGQSAFANSMVTLDGSEHVIPGTRIPVRAVLEYEGVQFDEIVFDLQVGTAGEGDPTGPDAYGYYAFDNTDIEYELSPTDLEWVEINPNDGNQPIDGIPVELNHGNRLNDFATMPLPFTFQYYGVSYDTILISTNGFVIMGNNELAVPSSQNWPLLGGGSGAASGMLAPFWDNFSLVPRGAEIYTGYDEGLDEVEGLFVIEWYLVYFNATDTRVTFQIILRDPAVYPTLTGDGEILFNYDRISQLVGADGETPYASVGITSPDGTTGISYSSCNTYDATAAPLQGRRSILFTTNVDDPTKAPQQEIVQTPDTFDFTAIYPNPFNSTTTINFNVDLKSEISLQVFDLSGRIVGSLLDGVIDQGSHSVEWSAADLATGLYLVNLQNGRQSVTRKIALIR